MQNQQVNAAQNPSIPTGTAYKDNSLKAEPALIGRWEVWDSPLSSSAFDQIKDRFPGAVAVSTPRHPFAYGASNIIVLPDPEQPELARRIAQQIVTDHNSHDALYDALSKIMARYPSTDNINPDRDDPSCDDVTNAVRITVNEAIEFRTALSLVDKP